MLIYIYPKCSTCQQALRFLEKKKVVYSVKDIVQDPPSVKELKLMLQYQMGDLKKLFNTSGQLYREMQLSEKLKTMSEQESLKLLSQHGMLIKRPFLLGKDFGLVGFHEDRWSAVI